MNDLTLVCIYQDKTHFVFHRIVDKPSSARGSTDMLPTSPNSYLGNSWPAPGEDANAEAQQTLVSVTADGVSVTETIWKPHFDSLDHKS